MRADRTELRAQARTLSVNAQVDWFRGSLVRERYPRHCHEAFAIGVIESGTGGLEHRGAVHHIPQGHIVTINAGDAHTGFAAGDRPLRYRMFYVQPSVLRGDGRTRQPHFRALCTDDRRWAARLVALHRLVESAPGGFETSVRTVEVLEGFGRRYGQCAPSAAPREPAAVARVKDYLASIYHRQVTIDELAALAGVSAGHLIRAFRRSTGMPPYTWLMQLRISRAQTLLARGHAIADVAYELGFADQSHLTRQFRRTTGVTPGEYAKGKAER